MANKCRYCEVLKWKEQTPGMFCSGGEVSVPTFGDPDEPTKSLLLYDSNESRRFLNRIRKYNSCFQMTLFGVGNEVIMPGISPTFTVQGQGLALCFPQIMIIQNFYRLILWETKTGRLTADVKILKELRGTLF